MTFGGRNDLDTRAADHLTVGRSPNFLEAQQSLGPDNFVDFGNLELKLHDPVSGSANRWPLDSHAAL